METYSVKAVLSAVDSNFTSTMKTANSSLAGIKTASESATSSIMKIASGIGVFKALSAGANLVKSSISSAMGRQDTMEAFNRTITQITGSAENATKALEDLKKITKGTAYGLDIAAKAKPTKDELCTTLLLVVWIYQKRLSLLAFGQMRSVSMVKELMNN